MSRWRSLPSWAQLAILVAVVGLLAVGYVSVRNAAGGSGEVTVDHCDAFGSGSLYANGTVTNNSGSTQSYVVHVSFNLPDGSRWAQGVSFENDLAPHQSAVWQTDADQDLPPGTSRAIHCVATVGP